MDFTTLKDRLIKLGYKVNCFETAKEAAEYIDNEIDNTTVGFGGSVTLQEMGLYEKLSAHNDVYWHWKTETMTADEARTKAREAAIYISSVNGIAETGEIINIDGNGNRVAEILYGHKKVYLVVGENKVAPDYERALYRARNIAGPLNAGRLNRKTPCAVKMDKCYNCASPDRICRGLTVLWESPYSCEYEVVLINEKLGY